MFTIDESVAPELYPLAFLIGRWEGTGVLGYANVEQTPFTQWVEFSHDGGPYLEYRAQLCVPCDQAEHESGIFTRVWSVESGYWRVVPGHSPVSAPAHDNGMPGAVTASVEVLLSEPTGHLTLLVGEITGARIDLVSDAIVRTASAGEVAAVKRLYGLVEGELMWAIDMAAFGNPMASYASARLNRVVTEPEQS